MISLRKQDAPGVVERAYIKRGLNYNPFLREEEVFNGCKNGSFEVFAVVVDGETVGALATEILSNEGGTRHLNVIAVATERGIYEYKIQILRAIETLARERLCKKVIASGRVGWQELAEQAGYEHRIHLIFWRDIHD